MTTPDRYTYEPEPYERGEWLREEYVKQGRSTVELAEVADVSHQKIRAELRRHDIETRPAPDRKPDHWDMRGDTNDYVGPPEETEADSEPEVDWSEVNEDG